MAFVSLEPLAVLAWRDDFNDALIRLARGATRADIATYALTPCFGLDDVFGALPKGSRILVGLVNSKLLPGTKGYARIFGHIKFRASDRSHMKLAIFYSKKTLAVVGSHNLSYGSKTDVSVIVELHPFMSTLFNMAWKKALPLSRCKEEK